MADRSSLLKVDRDFQVLVMEADRATISTAMLDWAEAGLTTRVVRGRKMRRLTGLLDEFAAALQFPLYFGENLDAFNECIADLENLPPGNGFVVVITEPDQVLADEGQWEDLRWLGHSLGNAADQWSQPVERGEWWDRPAIPFHVVLACETERMSITERRWSQAEVTLSRF